MTGAAVQIPRVTVLMPVYNGVQHLREAIESILGQTFRDYEFLIINDGSTDASESIIRSYDDPRIRLVNNETNLKLIATLNKGLGLARGEYVARMDCDDISLPERLQKQLSFLDSNSSVAIVGSWCRTIGGEKTKLLRYPQNRDKLKCSLLFGSPLAHPTVIFRRELFQRHAFWYDPAFLHAEDYELWVRVAESFDLGMLPEVLLRYRVHEGQVTKAHLGEMVANSGKVWGRLLRRMGLEPTEQQMLIHRVLAYAALEPGVDLQGIDDWLCAILRANAASGYFLPATLTESLVERFLTLVKKNGKSIEWSGAILAMKFLKEGDGALSSMSRFLLANLTDRVSSLFPGDSIP